MHWKSGRGRLYDPHDTTRLRQLRTRSPLRVSRVRCMMRFYTSGRQLRRLRLAAAAGAAHLASLAARPAHAPASERARPASQATWRPSLPPPAAMAAQVDCHLHRRPHRLGLPAWPRSLPAVPEALVSQVAAAAAAAPTAAAAAATTGRHGGRPGRGTPPTDRPVDAATAQAGSHATSPSPPPPPPVRSEEAPSEEGRAQGPARTHPRRRHPRHTHPRHAGGSSSPRPLLRRSAGRQAVAAAAALGS